MQCNKSMKIERKVYNEEKSAFTLESFESREITEVKANNF